METATIERSGATTFGGSAARFIAPYVLGVGSVILVDGRTCTNKLRACPLNWAPYRIDSQQYGCGLGVSVTVTGRQIVKVRGGRRGVRVNVEYLGDGEPSNHVGGYWLLLG